MIGLLFGSFNPVHIGHLIIAEYMLLTQSFEEVWFVVSPQNPHKKKSSLLDAYERLYMVELAIEQKEGLRTCNIEFHMPKPSFTIDTLNKLKLDYPDKDFGMIIGMDSLLNMHRWKEGDSILETKNIYVYPRPGFLPTKDFFDRENIHITDAPLVDISSTMIRRSIAEAKPFTYMMPNNVYKYIDKQLFYQ
ncbi:MAG: nicotinate-nucleotide adenylyltransferase [Flavobacteriales bacterium]|nr:MAG: nicotinate-nucleotide adenylyltransferase [Flavobacteriales bacterium]